MKLSGWQAWERQIQRIERRRTMHRRVALLGALLILVAVAALVFWAINGRARTQLVGTWRAGDRVITLSQMNASGKGEIVMDGQRLHYILEAPGRLVVVRGDGEVVQQFTY